MKEIRIHLGGGDPFILEAEIKRLRVEREALMEGLGLDPSPECRDEYPPERLKAEGYGLRMLVERMERDHKAALEALRIRVWNRTLSACGGIGDGEKYADYVIKAFD